MGGESYMRTKRLFTLLLAACLGMSLLLTACGGSSKVDYENAEDFEAALNAGEDLTGKVVSFTVSELIPDSAFGYNMTAGEHLNFCSESNPGAKAGDTVKVKVTKVASMFGSWIISYKKVK